MPSPATEPDIVEMFDPASDDEEQEGLGLWDRMLGDEPEDEEEEDEGEDDDHITSQMDVLLYGIFIVLFCVAMHLLYHRKTPDRTIFIVLTAAMAVLATTQLSLLITTTALALRLLHASIADGQLSVPSHAKGVEHLYWSLLLAEDVVLVTNTFEFFFNFPGYLANSDPYPAYSLTAFSCTDAIKSEADPVKSSSLYRYFSYSGPWRQAT
ncbi:hypothetical protein B0H10DRAFT_2437743 [Mycena sp. CBHHK59/15]|nr:hypothetical protein B0H10DRAFT_2437743 [Mycena sp. CBHHK59/15]